MTDPATYARLTDLQARLTQPTPRPLEGQQQIPVDEDDTPAEPPTQPPLW